MVFSNIIDGAPAEAGDTVPNVNPSDTRDVIGEFARAGAADVERTAAAAAAYAREFYATVKTAYVAP